MSNDLKSTILRVGIKYIGSSKALKITIGKIMEGRIKNSTQGVKYNEQSFK